MIDWDMLSPFWWAAGSALLLAIIATLADVRRSRRKRRRLEDVGFMPWRTISVAAFFIALIAASLAFHGY